VMVRLIKRYIGKRAAVIGDRGNGVSMIQVASMGIGVVDKEGSEASLAADYSLTEFSYIGRLLLVHGRNRQSSRQHTNSALCPCTGGT